MILVINLNLLLNVFYIFFIFLSFFFLLGLVYKFLYNKMLICFLFMFLNLILNNSCKKFGKILFSNFGLFFLKIFFCKLDVIIKYLMFLIVEFLIDFR